MGTFADAFGSLNAAQKQAVEQIDGPVLVVAGPGTGKTQLLGVRVGEILKRDAGLLPGNILCLTFTDAAAANLRERLVKGIGLGQDAYRVAIHTFNSFGSWIMTSYPEFFFDWREATTADELTTHHILEELLGKLPGDAPLAARGMDGTFFAQRRVRHFISDSKRAGLTPKDIRQVLEANAATFKALAPVFNEFWPQGKRGAAAAEASAACLSKVEAKAEELEGTTLPANLTPIATILLDELRAAAQGSNDLEGAAKTKPFTAWKNRWLELDANKQLVFKAEAKQAQLRAAVDLYEKYQKKLHDEGFVDFDDQIMTVLKTLEANEALRLNLQERFQYIMIDEYQDTNRAQLRMAQLLTDASVHEGRPNILVVGDDDQAIYRFQGADMSNIGAFSAAYREPKVIALTENYRSNKDVLSAARHINTQIALSLEKQTGVSKELAVHVALQDGGGTKLHEFAHEAEHYAWIAEEIEHEREKGHEVAVLARERSQLDALVPYLRTRGVPMDYERRENVLEQPHVVALLTLARLVFALSEDELDLANALLPEVLSQPMWGITPADLWRISREAKLGGQLWFDVIFEQDGTPARKVADFLLELSQQANVLPLELVLDELIGVQPSEEPEKFVSPFKTFYFGQELLDEKPAAYLTLLSHLASLRRNLRAYQQSTKDVLYLKDFIQFIDAWQRAGLVMLDSAAHREDHGAVKLMTAHKAKGQEFETVFVIGLEDSSWDKNASTSRFTYPANLAEIKPSDNDADDALRLLFVAMTRAKQTLHLCYFKQNEGGKGEQPFAPLLALGIQADTPQATHDAAALAQEYEARWTARHASVDGATKHELLAPLLETYALSATHFTSFLDVARGGPGYFLTQHLLGFPQATAASASFGTAVHRTLRRAHELVANGQAPTSEQLVGHFGAELLRMPLDAHDRAQFLHRGEEALKAYFAQELPNFSKEQKAEVDFKHEGVVLGEAKLKGVIDRMDLDETEKRIDIADYKTGHAYGKWELPPSSKEFERIKLHHYRQQLMFYDVLVSGANDWGKRGWHVGQSALRFVEPDTYGAIRTLVLDAGGEERERFEALVKIVWKKIMALDFPDVSRYEPSLAGIKKLEDDLLSGSI
ncbi:MAG TPA: ATP-dependent DNA helicase [Candidatus Saccharimonadales bacterium]